MGIVRYNNLLLRTAVQHNLTKCVLFLLKLPVVKACIAQGGFNALKVAARANNKVILLELLDLLKNKESFSNHFYSFLTFAAERDNVQLVEYLLDRKDLEPFFKRLISELKLLSPEHSRLERLALPEALENRDAKAICDIFFDLNEEYLTSQYGGPRRPNKYSMIVPPKSSLSSPSKEETHQEQEAKEKEAKEKAHREAKEKTDKEAKETQLITNVRKDISVEKLFTQITAMGAFGKQLGKNNKGDVAEYLAGSLEKMVRDFIIQVNAKDANPENKDEKALKKFKDSFKKELSNKQKELQVHHAIWKPLLANILIALTGVGIVALMVRALVVKIVDKKESPFFNKYAFFGKTHLEQLADKASVAIEGINDTKPFTAVPAS